MKALIRDRDTVLGTHRDRHSYLAARLRAVDPVLACAGTPELRDSSPRRDAGLDGRPIRRETRPAREQGDRRGRKRHSPRRWAVAGGLALLFCSAGVAVSDDQRQQRGAPAWNAGPHEQREDTDLHGRADRSALLDVRTGGADVWASTPAVAVDRSAASASGIAAAFARPAAARLAGWVAAGRGAEDAVDRTSASGADWFGAAPALMPQQRICGSPWPCGSSSARQLNTRPSIEVRRVRRATHDRLHAAVGDRSVVRRRAVGRRPPQALVRTAVTRFSAPTS